MRILHVQWRDVKLFSDVWWVGAAALAAGAITIPVRAFASGLAPLTSLALCTAAFSLAYVTAVLAFRIVTSEERELVRRKVVALARTSRSRAVQTTH
jgi:hypothetical protein